MLIYTDCHDTFRGLPDVFLAIAYLGLSRANIDWRPGCHLHLSSLQLEDLLVATRPE